MALTNVDVPFQATTSRMPRPQLLRRSFGTSQNTPPGSKRGSARIVKTGSASGSPHNIQRRRTTASHAVRATHAVSQTTPFHGPSTVGTATWSDQPRRPMSWHPGSRAYQVPAAAHWSNDNSLGNTIADFETLAVSGPIQPLFEGTVDTDHFSTGSGGYPDQQGSNYTGWDNLAMDCSVHHYPSLPYQSMLDTDQYYAQPPPYGSYGQNDLPVTNLYDATVQPTTYQLPVSAEVMPIQYPLKFGYGEELACSRLVTPKKSRELVGMGLYDDKNGSMLPATDLTGMENHSTFTCLTSGPMGKGLKLEETWQPPSEEPTDEAEDSSSDEAEDLPVAPPSQQPQTKVFSGYEDLSNQTFFFDNDDQYTEYIAFDPAMQFSEQKAPDPMSANFLWL